MAVLRYFYTTPGLSKNVKEALDDKVDKEEGMGLSQNDYTDTEKDKLEGVEDGAEVNVQVDWNEQDTESDAYIQNKPSVPILDPSGQIPASYLPSYVDDVLEYPTYSSLPQSGETGKIYVTTDTDLAYRWSGSTYVEISKSIITGVKGDAESNYRIGNVNLTAANIGLGNVVNLDQSKAIKSITRSGTTFTYTCLDGTTGTFTQQDNNTTYNAGSGLSLSGTTFSLALTKAMVTTALGYTPPTSDTNTWRGITDSYSGTDSTVSLSQKGGKALYDALLNGYASSAGNADTVDNFHASGLTKFYLSPMSSGAPADSAKSWFTGTMPSASGAIIYNVPGSEKTIIAGKSSGAYGHMLQLNYDDNYLRLLRYQGGTWKSTDWEKISAGYADSAGNADTVDSEHASAFAHIGAHNNLTASGNEFTTASSGFSGAYYWNYRTAGGTNGNITSYVFGNGKGGSLASITSGTFNGNCTGSAGSVAWSNVSSKPETATRWPSWSEVTSKPCSFYSGTCSKTTSGDNTIFYVSMSAADAAKVYSMEFVPNTSSFVQGAINYNVNMSYYPANSWIGIRPSSAGITSCTYRYITA